MGQLAGWLVRERTGCLTGQSAGWLLREGIGCSAGSLARSPADYWAKAAAAGGASSTAPALPFRGQAPAPSAQPHCSKTVSCSRRRSRFRFQRRIPATPARARAPARSAVRPARGGPRVRPPRKPCPRRVRLAAGSLRRGRRTGRGSAAARGTLPHRSQQPQRPLLSRRGHAHRARRYSPVPARPALPLAVAPARRRRVTAGGVSRRRDGAVELMAGGPAPARPPRRAGPVRPGDCPRQCVFPGQDSRGG